MQPKLLISIENAALFYAQLIKHGVESEKAVKAAMILASGKPDELLADEDRQLLKDAFRQWSSQHQHHQQLNSVLNLLNTYPILSV